MNAKTKRARFEKKDDFVRHGSLTAEEIACDYGVAPFDRAYRDMDMKWGIDRLPQLVSTETAAKFGSALAKMNTAIEAADPKETAARAGVCIRGLAAMDAEATGYGAKPAARDIWEVQADGITYGIMRDSDGWQAIKAERPDLILVSLNEVAQALSRNSVIHQAVEQVTAAFPNAKVKRAEQKPVADWNVGDPIPF